MIYQTEISVYNNGGKVKCVVHHNQETNQYSIDLIGNATNEYKAQIEVDLQQPEQFRLLSKEIFDKETEQYSKLQAEVQSYLETVL